MNNKLLITKDNIIHRGLEECTKVLHRKDASSNVNGKHFFTGVKKGFKLCQEAFCLEQLEALLIYYLRDEGRLIADIQKDIKFSNLINTNNSPQIIKLAKIRGIRSAINYIYDTLNLLMMENK